jgi:hypothetical protein
MRHTTRSAAQFAQGRGIDDGTPTRSPGSGTHPLARRQRPLARVGDSVGAVGEVVVEQRLLATHHRDCSTQAVARDTSRRAHDDALRAGTRRWRRAQRYQHDWNDVMRNANTQGVRHTHLQRAAQPQWTAASDTKTRARVRRTVHIRRSDTAHSEVGGVRSNRSSKERLAVCRSTDTTEQHSDLLYIVSRS